MVDSYSDSSEQFVWLNKALDVLMRLSSKGPKILNRLGSIFIRFQCLGHFYFVCNLEPLNWLLWLDRVNENAVVAFINFIQSQIP
jgi:hypothetical protein